MSRRDEARMLRAELDRRDADAQAAAAAQRRADETGWDPVSGRWSKPTRTTRDRLARSRP